MSDPTSLLFKNRMGRIYYLLEVKTSTGKPKYYTSRKLSGTPLAAMPLGYEFYERPDTAQVLVRKIKPSPITQLERKQTEEIVRRVCEAPRSREFLRADVSGGTAIRRSW